jgi:hypothetical protein
MIGVVLNLANIAIVAVLAVRRRDVAPRIAQQVA